MHLYCKYKECCFSLNQAFFLLIHAYFFKTIGLFLLVRKMKIGLGLYPATLLLLKSRLVIVIMAKHFNERKMRSLNLMRINAWKLCSENKLTIFKLGFYLS